MDIKIKALVVILLLSSCKTKKSIEVTKTDSVINKVEQVEVLSDSGKIETTEQIIYEFDTIGSPFISPDKVLKGEYKIRIKSIKVNRHIKEDKALKSLKIDKAENKSIKVEKTAIVKETSPCINELLILLALLAGVYFLIKKL